MTDLVEQLKTQASRRAKGAEWATLEWQAAARISQLEAALRPFVDIIKDERQVFGDDYPVAINSSTVPKPFVDAAIAALGK